eukprot:3253942-Prorocentrum_lima.AAC.1
MLNNPCTLSLTSRKRVAIALSSQADSSLSKVSGTNTITTTQPSRCQAFLYGLKVSAAALA